MLPPSFTTQVYFSLSEIRNNKLLFFNKLTHIKPCRTSNLAVVDVANLVEGEAVSVAAAHPLHLVVALLQLSDVGVDVEALSLPQYTIPVRLKLNLV